MHRYGEEFVLTEACVAVVSHLLVGETLGRHAEGLGAMIDHVAGDGLFDGHDHLTRQHELVARRVRQIFLYEMWTT